MTRAQTLLLLAAVVLASLSAVDIGGRERPVLAVGAIGIMAAVGYLRLRASLGRPKRQRTFDAYDRALRIQEERDEKFRR